MKLYRMYFLVATATAGLFFFLPAAAQSEVPELIVETGPVSEDGHLKLAWDMVDQTDRVEVQQSNDVGFDNPITVYEGPDNATVISGLDDGTYYFRLKHIDGAWSDTARVTVQHHSLSLALTLCGLGAIVFLCTVAVVVSGARTQTEN